MKNSKFFLKDTASMITGALSTFADLKSEIDNIIHTAKTRWPLDGVTVIHRVGRLLPQENIVFVGCASAHRQAEFEAAHYIMDYLKTRAPIWKKEHYRTHSSWVQSKEEDELILNDW